MKKSRDGDTQKVSPPVCKAADTPAHRARPAHLGQDGACACGYCHTCHHTRKRHRRRVARLGSVRRLYGLSEIELEAIVKSQTGPDGKLRCPCGGVLGVSRSPCVDHWHGCPHCAGKGCRRCVRGLLHQTCNQFLGRVGDRPSALIGLAWHVQAWPAQAVLTALDRGATMDTSPS